MRMRKLEIHRFRGLEQATIVPAGHVVLVGEPGAGRSDVIEALNRVLSPDSTRGRLPTELDFFRRDTTKRAEVEVVLGALGQEMEQVFFDHLEVWDQEAGELIEQFADPASVDRDRYDLAVRLCYRASWDTKEGQAQHWVDYPKTADRTQTILLSVF
jgi:putative ATP-dependent endonuclease of the OLD family